MNVHVVRAGSSLADVPDDDLVVIAADPWLVDGVEGVAAAFAAETLVERAVLSSPDGRIVVGCAADVRAGSPTRVSRRLFTHRPGVTEAIVLNGELLDVVAGVPVAVVVDASPALQGEVASDVTSPVCFATTALSMQRPGTASSPTRSSRCRSGRRSSA